MAPNREELERRLNALVADFLDSLTEDYEEGFDLGVALILAEVRYPADAERIEDLVARRPRPEAQYTPEAQWHHTVWFRCTDHRDWVQAGLLHEALRLAHDYDTDDEDDGADEDRPDDSSG